MGRADGTNPRALGANPRELDPLKDLDLTAEELREIMSLSPARYRRTKHWRQLRKAVNTRADGFCERCGQAARLDVHHRTYERVGEELLDDLLGLCRDCHQEVHGLTSFKLEGNWLKRHDGTIVGRVVSMQVELLDQAVSGEPLRRGAVAVEEQQPLELEDASRDGGSGGKGEIEQVWATYVEAMGPRDPGLYIAERKLIRDALKVATVTECQRAIWGCRRSPFHMGDNSARRKYNRLSHILKGKRGVRTLREQIDFMLDLADKHAVGELDARGSEQTVIDPAKLERMKRQVWRAFDMPDSEQAAEQGQRAEAWLVEHGWRVVRSGNDRPRIERKDS